MIVAAGPRNKVKISRGATRIDGTEERLAGSVGYARALRAGGVGRCLFRGLRHNRPRQCNEFEYMTAIRDALNQGKGVGQRLLVAGIVAGDAPSALGVVRANTPAEAKAVVERYLALGFKQIKIYSGIPTMAADIAAQVSSVA